MSELKIETEKLQQSFEELRLITMEGKFSTDIIYRLKSNIDNISFTSILIAQQYDMCLAFAKQAYSNSTLPPNSEDLMALLNEINKFSVSINSFFLFIRSLQDNLYRLLLELDKESWGVRSSMHNAFKKNKYGDKNKYGEWINNIQPNYFTWFQDMRELRNVIKTGSVNTGGSFDPKAQTFSCSYIAFEKNGHKTSGYSVDVSIKEILDSIVASQELLSAICRYSKTNNRI